MRGAFRRRGVEKLIAARDREVAHRRDVAKLLAEKYNRGDTENTREYFIKIQEAIEATRSLDKRCPITANSVRLSSRPIFLSLTLHGPSQKLRQLGDV
jgi:hypothetical protein